jgi:multicomponent Na+:H+ antiporter subunit E
MKLLSLTLALFLFWLLLSGIYTPFLVLSGLISSFLIALLASKLDALDHEGHPIHLAPKALLSYWPWLFKEIFKSAWSVCKIIGSPSLPISPALKKITIDQHSDLGRVIYANSITLTPGTIAVEIEHREILVHALEEISISELEVGEMDRRVIAFEQSLNA